MATVTLRNIVKLYGEFVAVKGIDIDIEDGTFVVLVGPSGCGKSTLLRMIAGLETISYGDLKIGGKSVNDLPSRDRGIAMVFQSYALYPHMSVSDNLGFGLKISGVEKSEIERRRSEAATMLGLTPYLDRRPSQLSGGQRQREPGYHCRDDGRGHRGRHHDQSAGRDADRQVSGVYADFDCQQQRAGLLHLVERQSAKRLGRHRRCRRPHAYWDAAIANGDYTEAQRELVSVDGKPYGVLLNVANWVVFHNTEAFEKAGIAAPPTTWEELMSDAELLKAAGHTPFNAPTSGSWMPLIWFSQLVLGTSPDAFVGLTDGSVAYDGPEVQNAFKVWGEMYAKGYFTDPREQDDQKFFVDKSAAMYLIGDWHSGSFAAAGMEPGVDFKTFLMPSLSPDVEQAVIVEAASIVVSAAVLTANADLGKAVQSMMGEAASNALGSEVQVYNGNLKAAAPNATIEANKEMVAAANPRALVRWWEAVPAQIQGDLVAAMGAFMFDPTPEQAAKSMADMQTINADYWANL